MSESNRNFVSVEKLGKKSKKTEERSCKKTNEKSTNSTKRGKNKKFAASKSEEPLECVSTGVLLLSSLNGYKETCKCDNCQRDVEIPQIRNKRLEKISTQGGGTIASDLDSTTSRSTLKLRARSWPLLLPHQDGDEDQKKTELGYSSPVAQVRRLLWRHYYPEGGWGYVVVTCCVLVNILNHGLQLSYGIFHEPIAAKFHVGVTQTGKLISFT